MPYKIRGPGEKVNMLLGENLPQLLALPLHDLGVKNSPSDLPGERLGAFLAQARERSGLTQEAVERELHLMCIKYSREGYRSLEAGEVELPKKAVILAIAKILNLNMADVLLEAGFLDPADRDPFIRHDRLRVVERQMEAIVRLLGQGVEEVRVVRQSLEEQLMQT